MTYKKYSYTRCIYTLPPCNNGCTSPSNKTKKNGNNKSSALIGPLLTSNKKKTYLRIFLNRTTNNKHEINSN